MNLLEDFELLGQAVPIRLRTRPRQTPETLTFKPWPIQSNPAPGYSLVANIESLQ